MERTISDDRRLLVEGLPDQDCFQITVAFRIDNKPPEHSLGKPVTVSMSPTRASLHSMMEGNEAIAYHDAVLMQGGGAIEVKQITRLFQSFQEVVRADMEDKEMSFLAEE